MNARKRRNSPVETSGVSVDSPSPRPGRTTDSPGRAYLVRMYTGPLVHLQLREVGGIRGQGWTVVSVGDGPGIEGRLRRSAARRGYVVEDGVRVEDWRHPGLWPARGFAEAEDAQPPSETE